MTKFYVYEYLIRIPGISFMIEVTADGFYHYVQHLSQDKDLIEKSSDAVSCPGYGNIRHKEKCFFIDGQMVAGQMLREVR